MSNVMIRLTTRNEIELFEWLRGHFNLAADLPLGLSEKGEPQPIGAAVTTLVWGAFAMMQAHQEGVAPDLAQIYEIRLKELQNDLANETPLSPAEHAFAEELLQTFTEQREAMLRIAQGLPDILPEITQRYHSGEDAIGFFDSLVAGQQYHLFLILGNT